MSRKINWKKQLRREEFFLKRGRFPKKRELERKRGPVLMFGHNTI